MSDNEDRASITAQAADYFLARRAGRVTEADNQEFLRWLRVSPVHVAEYLAITEVSNGLRATAKDMNLSVDRLMEEVHASDNIVPLTGEKSRHATAEAPFRRPRIVFGTLAASVAIAAAAAWTWPLVFGTTYTTGRGEQRTLQLPDSSVVHLDSDSSVCVKYSSHQRVVTLLRGQAYFEVMKDAARPFQVSAGETVINDIGTVFDVFLKPNDTVVTVVEGEVSVHSAPPDQNSAEKPHEKVAIDLNAGDQATIRSSGAVETKKVVNLQKAIAWTRNEIVFDGESVASVAAEFNRYNRIQIVVDDPAVAELPISGVFHTFDVNSFQQFLGDLPGVSVAADNHSVRVSRSKQN